MKHISLHLKNWGHQKRDGKNFSLWMSMKSHMAPNWLLFFLHLFIYLFLAVLGLRFCARAFSSCGKRGPIFIAVHGPLTIVASLVAEHRFQTRRLSNCGSRAQLLRGMWDLPRPGPEPVSPALAGRLSTTVPPGKTPNWLLKVSLADATPSSHKF